MKTETRTFITRGIKTTTKLFRSAAVDVEVLSIPKQEYMLQMGVRRMAGPMVKANYHIPNGGHNVREILQMAQVFVAASAYALKEAQKLGAKQSEFMFPPGD